jgi:uncharacterized protein (DUF1697 family)
MPLVLFLRGVNVGGYRTFRPSLLAQQLKRYETVNIGAAGTFVLLKPPGQVELRAELHRRLPFEAEIMICSGRELATAVAGDVFGNELIRSDCVRFVSVLGKRPRLLPRLPLALPPDGQWLLRILATRNRFVFGMYRRHMKTIRYLGMIDTLFGVPVTTRNWNTFASILTVLNRGAR